MNYDLYLSEREIREDNYKKAYENQQKYIKINHSSTFNKKQYFPSINQKNEKPIKVLLNPKEKIIDFSPFKSFFNKSNTKLVSNIFSFLEFKDMIQLKYTNKHFQKLLSNKKILREYALRGVMSSENRIKFYETLINFGELKKKIN